MGSGSGSVLRSALATFSSLGAVHALAGATQFTYTRQPPITATVGTAIAPFAFTVTGAQHPPGSFRVTNIPPGLVLTGDDGNGLVTASSGIISGTPVTDGTFQMTILAYEFADGKGDTFGPTIVTFDISPGAAIAPSFTTHPASQSVGVGATVTFTAAAGGSPSPTLQWRKNGSPIAGATTGSLTIPSASAADAGDYSVVATNSAGSVTSNPATLTVSSVVNTARLSNLSVRTAMTAGQVLTVGFVVNGGSRNVLVRAAGPALATFGLLNVMADPRLELYNDSSQMVLANDNWPSSLTALFESLGAFGFAPGSNDAALVQGINAAYTVRAQGTGPGVVLVEAYDSGGGSGARLVNVSALNRVGTDDDILIAGFVLAGVGDKRLLIRAVGPTLAGAPFNVPGTLVDPKLEVYRETTKLTESDDWAPGLASTFTSVGAFALEANSRDAALVTTLAAGHSYTVQVKGADGGTGQALVEIYELP